LMDAYSKSVQQTIDMGELKKLTETVLLMMQLSYGVNDTIINLLKPVKAKILNTSYTDRVEHKIEIEKKNYVQVENLLTELQSQGKINFQVISQG